MQYTKQHTKEQKNIVYIIIIKFQFKGKNIIFP